jgi:hypothetical protein
MARTRGKGWKKKRAALKCTRERNAFHFRIFLLSAALDTSDLSQPTLLCQPKLSQTQLPKEKTQLFYRRLTVL